MIQLNKLCEKFARYVKMSYDYNESTALIIGMTDTDEKVTAASGRISTQEGTALSIWDKSQDREKNKNLIGKVTASGHTSTVEHTYFNLAFQNVTAVVEQFIIEFRLASFTVKSRRYVNFSDAGFYVPDFGNDEIKASYTEHMSKMFALYGELCDNGIAREDARFVLPYCLFSNFFCSVNGREFLNMLRAMIYGRGAKFPEIKRLGEQLLSQAKEKAPCIVFIDEIDAVGRARGKNVGFSSNDERENTLNQLLTEMDGFGTNSGVIVLAATNRADILDKALMRAGRFDRQINVTLPDLNERKEIFQVHLAKIKLADGFDLDTIAKHTPGFSGADIANVCNEAALTAARHDKQSVDNSDFMEAVDRVVGGIERKKTIMSQKEKMLTAYHEAGHAVTGWLLEGCDPVLKVSIVPRGQALGLTWSLPDEKVMMSRSDMIDNMCCLVGGRVAEEIVNNGVPCTGALNDFERMTKMAYSMVAYYGMSDKVGNVSFYNADNGYSFSKPYSEKTAELIDDEVRELVGKVTDRTRSLLIENWSALEKLAETLVEKEVITASDIEAVLGPKAGEHGEDRLK